MATRCSSWHHYSPTRKLSPRFSVQSRKLPENVCVENEDVPEHVWKGRVAMFSGSMLVASVFFFLIGLSGAVGVFARHVGPITIVPLLTLLAIAVVPTIEEKMTSHYMAVVTLALLVLFAMYLENFEVPCPYYSFKHKEIRIYRAPLIGQFSFMLAMLVAWFICWILTITGAVQDDSIASTNYNVTAGLVSKSPWFKVPYPGEYGAFKLNTALCLGYGAAVLSQIVENIGSYKMGASVSDEGTPPRDAINRGIMVEGFGSVVASLVGIPVGVTTFAGNIALLQFTRVVSRVTVQIVGVMYIVLGLFTKTVNLNLTRNLAIMGLSLIIGIMVPRHFEKNPIKTSSTTWNQVFNMLLSIEMLIGGGLAFILDNTIPGATEADRGLVSLEDEVEVTEAFWMPAFVDRWLSATPWLRKVPFLPSKPNPKQCDCSSSLKLSADLRM